MDINPKPRCWKKGETCQTRKGGERKESRALRNARS